VFVDTFVEEIYRHQNYCCFDANENFVIVKILNVNVKKYLKTSFVSFDRENHLNQTNCHHDRHSEIEKKIFF